MLIFIITLLLDSAFSMDFEMPYKTHTQTHTHPLLTPTYPTCFPLSVLICPFLPPRPLPYDFVWNDFDML